jgi:uncharacterized protein with ParB-like and HNH nuclease domain
MTIKEAIIEVVDNLDAEQQRLVLTYVQALSKRPKGLTGEEFLERTKHIHIDEDDLKQMEEAIEEAFEQVGDLPEIKFGS